MAQGRRVCLAIGISDAGGGLDYLGGALNGARGIHAWATALGYESTLLTDQKTPVSVTSVAEALRALLPHGSVTDRLILYFAGHGLISQGDNGLWLLNGWREEKRGVAVEVLRRRLREFGVTQIAIIADACRKLPQDMDFGDVTQDGVLGSGFTRPTSDPLIDRFTATQDGLAAYMIPGTTPEDDRCIFSGVLLEGLWGQSVNAFSKRDVGKVISSSLADFLRTRVPEVAGKYHLSMSPQVQTGFPELADVYFDRADPPLVAPGLVAWPDAPRNEAFDRLMEPTGAKEVSDDSFLATAIDGLGTLLGGGKKQPGTLGTGTGSGGLDLGSLMSGIFGKSGTPKHKRAKSTVPRPDGVSETDWETLKAEGILRSGAPLKLEEKRQLDWLVERGRSLANQQAEQAKQRQSEAKVLALIRSAQVPDQLQQGLVVAGGQVARIWGPPDLKLKRRGKTMAWNMEGLPFGEARQLMLEFEDGCLGACVLMNAMVTRLGKDESGVAALVLQPGHSSYDEVARSITMVEMAVARLTSDTLLDDSEATDLATHLRMIKHVNPVLGVISAYLYDAIGDLDSIRRMAFYYVQHRQAIPYDIAFLADLWSRDRGDGVLEVDVPAQPQRQPRTQHEAQFVWTTSATQAVKGLIAGRIPWMRQGWPFLASPTESERMMAGGIADVRSELMPSKFSTLKAQGGHHLISLFGLKELT